MDRRLHREVARWLEGLSGGRFADAEVALRAALRRLPRPAPPPGFAARVLAAAGLFPAQAPPRAVVALLHAALAAALVLAGLALAFLPGVVASLLPAPSPSVAIEACVALLAALARRLVDGLVVWRALSEVGYALAGALSRPAPLVAALAGALLAAAAFRSLHELLASERNIGHVDSR